MHIYAESCRTHVSSTNSVLRFHIHQALFRIYRAFFNYSTLQHTATHCNTLQHTATHCDTLQHTATYCSTRSPVIQIIAAHCNTLQYTATHCYPKLNTNTHCTAHCSVLQWAAYCSVLQWAAIIHCYALLPKVKHQYTLHSAFTCGSSDASALQHTATNCNTLQNTATHTRP